MPVLSEAAVTGLDLPYIVLGGSVVVALGVVISRRSKKSPTLSHPLPISEKVAPAQEPYTVTSPPMNFPRHPLRPAANLAGPPPPLPFTPPVLSTTIFPAPSSLSVDTEALPAGSGGGLNASYYQDFVSSPVELETPAIYDEPAALSGSPSPRRTQEMGGVDFLPRRRSYTKSLSQSSTSSNGSVSSTSSSIIVSGEVISGEGWRRHTRVFGGGVCKACEESERRMTA